MNFYFKASERSQRGFEFTHKSFGEYLSARALLYIAKEVGLQSIKKQDYLNMEGQTLSGIYSHDVNFDGSILRNSLIASSNMFSGSFENADLEGCRFYESRIEKMNFSGAYVDGMIFHASKIKYSNFSNIRGGFIAVFPLTLISSSGNLTKDLGDRMRILSTADGAVERAIDAVLGGIEILRQTEDEYRDGLVEDIH